jgi:proton-translocating NADH-quinone oxidoreductase chain M
MTFLLTQPILAIVLLLSLAFIVALFSAPSLLGTVKQACLVVSLLSLFIGLLAALSFDKGTLGFQFMHVFSDVPQYNISLAVGVDGLSFVFLLLTLVTFPPLFLTIWSTSQSPKHFFCHLLAMELLLVLTFTTLDLFYFFVFFESLLIPMIILIGVWGSRSRRVKAAYYFFLYTLFGSLFMLFGMIYLYNLTGTLNYYTLMVFPLTAEDQFVVCCCFFIAFAVKIPMFPVHIWLLEAHVEAPTAGSMLLASLLLKLGGYGFLRFCLTFLPDATTALTPFVGSLALCGVIYGSLSTLRQIDLKRIIAYSSVSHMNLVVLAILSFKQEGLEGAVYLMVAHGLVSSALFFCVGVIYDRTHSRLLRYYGGLVTVMPLFATMLFLFSLANMSFPGTPNFLGELLMFVGIGQLSFVTLFFSTAGVVFSAAFSTFLFNRIAFTALKTKYTLEFTDMTRREFVVLLPLAVLSLALGLSSAPILDMTVISVNNLSLNGGTALAGIFFFKPVLSVQASSFAKAAPVQWGSQVR